MKNYLFLSICLVTLSLSPVFGAAGAEEKPLVTIPERFSREIIVSPQEVEYQIQGYKGKLDLAWISFKAGHDSLLKSIRIVIGDSTVYEWDIIRDSSGIVAVNGIESGEHLDSSVRIDRAKWLKFFTAKIALPAFEYRPEVSSTIIEEKVQWEFVGNTLNESVIRVPGDRMLKTIKNEELLFPLPKEGKFLIARKNGKICPVVIENEKWVVPLTYDLVPIGLSTSVLPFGKDR